MLPIEEQIDELKTYVMLAADLTIPVNRYHDLLEGDELLKLGVRDHPEELIDMCKLAAGIAFLKPANVVFTNVKHIAQCHFYHGAAIVNGCIALLFYYNDIRKGVLNVITENGARMIRISSLKSIEGEHGYYARPAEPATD